VKTDFEGIVLEWAVSTDVGCVRTLNEDSQFASPPVFVVADGMGGHDAGEVASAMTVEQFAAFAGSSPPEVEAVAREFQNIHERIRGAMVDGVAVDMGTTAVGLFLTVHAGVVGWLVANVGDSRAYSTSGGSLSQVTVDHSYVQELIDAGTLDADEARHHPQRNIITQALGAVEVIAPDFWIRPIRAGERFLLCTDGLTGEVEDREIESILLGTISPELAATTLTQRALDAGGHDNVTVIVVDVVTVPSDVDVSTETHPGASGVFSIPSAPAGSVDLLAPDGIREVPRSLILSDPEPALESMAVSQSLIDIVPPEIAHSEPEQHESITAVVTDLISSPPPGSEIEVDQGDSNE